MTSKLQFIVDNRATKPEIQRELEAAFGHPDLRHPDGQHDQRHERKPSSSFEDPKAAEEILSRLGVV